MEKNINILTMQVDENIRQYIQSSNLPIGVLHFIIQNLAKDIENQYYVTVNTLLTQNEITEEKIISTSEEQ